MNMMAGQEMLIMVSLGAEPRLQGQHAERLAYVDLSRFNLMPQR